MGERFADATKREGAGPNPLVLQAGVTPVPRQVTMATTADNAAVGIGYVLGTAAERERVLAADVLIDALAGSNEAPLKRKVLDAELAELGVNADVEPIMTLCFMSLPVK